MTVAQVYPWSLEAAEIASFLHGLSLLAGRQPIEPVKAISGLTIRGGIQPVRTKR